MKQMILTTSGWVLLGDLKPDQNVDESNVTIVFDAILLSNKSLDPNTIGQIINNGVGDDRYPIRSSIGDVAVSTPTISIIIPCKWS
jgi:hypothetical protein